MIRCISATIMILTSLVFYAVIIMGATVVGVKTIQMIT
jgi:hypothetical protein